jgi:mRNA-degrading endonuclease toxin of MazEF toxin-antitoxin module
MVMFQPGDVVTALFHGARQSKPGPSVVVSTVAYNAARPDVILGLLTTRLPTVIQPTDYMLQDWAAAALHAPSVFRVYLAIEEQTKVTLIGHLSDRDWQEIQARLRLGVAV